MNKYINDFILQKENTNEVNSTFLEESLCKEGIVFCVYFVLFFKLCFSYMQCNKHLNYTVIIELPYLDLFVNEKAPCYLSFQNERLFKDVPFSFPSGAPSDLPGLNS